METANRLVILEKQKQLQRSKCKDEGKKKVKKKVDFIGDDKDDIVMANESVPGDVPVTPMTDEDFENIFVQSMQDLETIKSDSDSDFGDDHGLPVKKVAAPPTKIRKKTVGSSSDSSVSDVEEDVYSWIGPKSPISPRRAEFPPFPPLVLPFAVRRRLSECLEEDEEEEKQTTHKVSNGAPTNGSHRTEPVPSPIEGKSPPSSDDPTSGVRKSRFMVTKASELPQLRPESLNLRPMSAAQNSQTIHFPCSQFSSPSNRMSLQSIFSPESPFPNPHLDKRFFDSSLVEIRPVTSSITSVAAAAEEEASTPGSVSNSSSNTPSTSTSTSTNANCKTIPFELDEVWVKRADTKRVPAGGATSASASKAATLPASTTAPYSSKAKKDVLSDTADGAGQFQRPSTAPAGTDSARSSKRQKKSEREAKKQEKEQKKMERAAG